VRIPAQARHTIRYAAGTVVVVVAAVVVAVVVVAAELTESEAYWAVA
jgi:hypothetical protein